MYKNIGEWPRNQFIKREAELNGLAIVKTLDGDLLIRVSDAMRVVVKTNQAAGKRYGEHKHGIIRPSVARKLLPQLAAAVEQEEAIRLVQSVKRKGSTR